MSEYIEGTLDWILNTPAMDIMDGRKDMLKPQTGERNWRVPAIKCTDGTTLSVQASGTHYCEPRDYYGPWYTVEVGFPSVEPPPSWKEYAEEWDKPTNTVYGYVPVKLVREFIEAHGGEAALAACKGGE